MKTVKELANEMGVERHTVKNIIYSLGLNADLVKRDNRFWLNEEQAAIIKRIYAERTGAALETSMPNESGENSALKNHLTQIEILFAAQKAEYERLFKEQQTQFEWLLGFKNAELARADALAQKAQTFVNALTDLLAAQADFENKKATEVTL